jgi:3-hydroxyacyl-CoA dehydrogenase
MTTTSVANLTVLGAGVLGGQIAWHSAFKGKQVVQYDLHQTALDSCRAQHEIYAAIYQADLGATPESIEAARSRLRFSTDLAAAVAAADLVIEAVPEVPDIKVSVYSDMAPHLQPHTIVASNSSTFLASMFADATGRPDKYACLHFANLIWHINLAEVMAHPGTSTATVDVLTQFAIEIGMVPVPICKEQNGYVINTMLIALLRSALSLVTSGVTDFKTVDRTFMIMNRGVGSGPFGTIDVVGMETAFNIMNYWASESQEEDLFKAAAWLKEQYIDKGRMGLQCGKGFYDYPNPEFKQPGFLDVPDIAMAPELAALAYPQ